jgi:hypothetical protein
MSPKDPADKDYKAPEPAPRDDDAEIQEARRAIVQAHGEGGAPKPPSPSDSYPRGEAAPGYHRGPPERLNCGECGHAHAASFSNAKCERCEAKLPDIDKLREEYEAAEAAKEAARAAAEAAAA